MYGPDQVDPFHIELQAPALWLGLGTQFWRWCRHHLVTSTDTTGLAFALKLWNVETKIEI